MYSQLKTILHNITTLKKMKKIVEKKLLSWFDSLNKQTILEDGTNFLIRVPLDSEFIKIRQAGEVRKGMDSNELSFRAHAQPQPLN